MPPLNAWGRWPVQEWAITNLEESLAAGRPQALVQMTTGSGKTFMTCSEVYRLIKLAGAKRVLFLVDRSNLGRQTLRDFQGFTTSDEGRKLTELYNVQLLQFCTHRSREPRLHRLHSRLGTMEKLRDTRAWPGVRSTGAGKSIGRWRCDPGSGAWRPAVPPPRRSSARPPSGRKSSIRFCM